MPQLEEQLKELEEKILQLETKLEDLISKLEKASTLLRNHTHSGRETSALESLIKHAKYIDGKEFRVGGTDGRTAVYTDKNDQTITVTKGIIV